jgi:phytanoyl-CoA hydroxylase
MSSPLNIFTKTNIMEITDTLLGAKTSICSSLYFEKGSQQSLHRDSPFFFTNPPENFVGFWLPLEDVTPLNGPVSYVPKSHLIPQEKLLNQISDREVSPFSRYCELISNEIQASKLKTEILTIKKGDLLIWHPLLVHGGSPINKKDASRHSLVFHLIPEDIPIYGHDEFFNKNFHPSRKVNHPRKRYHDLSFINHPSPSWAKNS